MKTLKVILLVFLIFAAGVAVGVVGTRVATRRFVQRALANPELMRLRIERELVMKLRLDAQQRKEVHDILLDSHERLRNLRQQFQPEFVSIMQDTRQKISDVLTPEQRERFEKLQEQTRHLWAPQQKGSPTAQN